MKPEKIWYSHKGSPYAGSFPPFFDASAYSWVAKLEAEADNIREEVMNYLSIKTNLLEPYFNKDIVSKKDAWKLMGLVFWDAKNPGAIQNFPVLYSAMSKIPGMVTCAISVMDADTTIRPHMGDTSAIIRCHLGIEIPAGLPECGLEVNGEQREWAKGKVIMFCDAYNHSAFNKTNKKRVVILFDVIQDQWIGQRKRICANALAILWIQKKKAKTFYKNLPGPLLGVIMRLYSLYMQVFGLRWFNP